MMATLVGALHNNGLQRIFQKDKCRRVTLQTAHANTNLVPYSLVPPQTVQSFR